MKKKTLKTVPFHPAVCRSCGRNDVEGPENCPNHHMEKRKTYVLQRYLGNGWVDITKPGTWAGLTKRITCLPKRNSYRVVRT